MSLFDRMRRKWSVWRVELVDLKDGLLFACMSEEAKRLLIGLVEESNERRREALELCEEGQGL